MMIRDGDIWREPLAAESAAGRARLQAFAEDLYLNEIKARNEVMTRKAAGDPTVRDTKLQPLSSFETYRDQARELQLRGERDKKRLNPHL